MKVLRRLPRFCRVGAITALCRDELRISQSFTHNAAQGFSESASVIVFALIKSKRLLIEIPKQMKRFHVHISSVQCAFEQRPEVFQAVRVDVAFCMTNGM